MKTADIAREEPSVPVPAFTMEDIYKDACRAVEEALARHKRLGQSIVVWQDGKVATLEPEEIGA